MPHDVVKTAFKTTQILSVTEIIFKCDQYFETKGVVNFEIVIKEH